MSEPIWVSFPVSPELVSGDEALSDEALQRLVGEMALEGLKAAVKQEPFDPEQMVRDAVKSRLRLYGSAEGKVEE